MAVRIIPTFSDGESHYEYTVILDGKNWYIHMDFNARDQHWYISVHDASDQPLEGCIGRKIVTNWNILNRANIDERPPGLLITDSTHHRDPTLLDLGVDVMLYYLEASNG